MIEDRVMEAEAVVRAAAAAHGELLERAKAGRRLARVEDRRARCLDRVDVAAVSVAIPLSRPSRFSAVRSPVSSARASPVDAGDLALTTSPSCAR